MRQGKQKLKIILIENSRQDLDMWNPAQVKQWQIVPQKEIKAHLEKELWRLRLSQVGHESGCIWSGIIFFICMCVVYANMWIYMQMCVCGDLGFIWGVLDHALLFYIKAGSLRKPDWELDLICLAAWFWYSLSLFPSHWDYGFWAWRPVFKLVQQAYIFSHFSSQD